MYIELACACGAILNIDGAEDTFTIMLATRFSDSHVECGFVTPLDGDASVKVVRKRLMDINFNDED